MTRAAKSTRPAATLANVRTPDGIVHAGAVGRWAGRKYTVPACGPAKPQAYVTLEEAGGQVTCPKCPAPEPVG